MDEISSTGMDRRNFLKGAAVFGGAIAASSLLSACGNAAPLTAAGVPEKWDYESDVVIVGYGGAGAAAAWEALSAGARTLILERAKQAGGSTNICGGFVTIGNSPLQQKLGFEDSADNYFNYLVAAGGPGVSEEHCRVMADSGADLYDWLVNTLGVKFAESYNPSWPETDNPDAGLTCSGDEYSSDYAGIATAVPRGHWVVGFGTPEGSLTGAKNGSGFFQPLLTAVEAMGPEVLYETPATRLVYDGQLGRVVGVVAETGDGEIFVKAARAVILTAGGFAKNADMVAQYCPYIADGFVIGTDGDDGKGIRIGQGVGADTRHMNFAYGNLTCAGFLNRNSGPGGPFSAGIIVNKRGQRFFAEDHYYTYLPDAMRNQYYYKDFPGYLIIDSKIMAKVAEGEGPDAESIVATADSIEALAAALGTPAGALESTLAYYNERAAKGEDSLYGKRQAYVQPIMTPPFYAIVAADKAGTFTWGGLKINVSTQVISALTQEPIPGLYSAGRNANDIFATFYQGSGLSVGTAFTFGRIAGKMAAAETAWTASE